MNDNHSPKESCLPVSNSHEVWLPTASLRGWGIRSLLRLEFWKHTFFFLFLLLCLWLLWAYLFMSPTVVLLTDSLFIVPTHTQVSLFPHSYNSCCEYAITVFSPIKILGPSVRHFHFQYFYFQYFHFPYFFLLNFSHLLFMLISFSRDPQTALL